MSRWHAVMLAAAVALLLPGCLGQRPSDILGSLPPPSPGALAVAHYFPSHPDKMLPAGEIIDVVVSARNTGARPLNVSAVVGSIHLPGGDQYVQNLTIGRYFSALAPGDEASLEYRFVASPLLGGSPPREYGLRLHLLFEVEGAYFRSTFFDATVHVAEPPRAVDFDLLWLAATMLVLAGGAAYAGYAALGERLGLFKGKGRRPRAAAAPKALDEDEWVKGTAYDVAKRRRAAAAKKA